MTDKTTPRDLPTEIMPVDQTVVGIGNDRANCFQACLAMISGLSLEDCIDITDPAVEDMWVDAVIEWAAQYGWAFKSGIRPPTDRPCIANGPTADREGVHGVVCAGGNLVHDPHPSRSGIVSVNWWGWLEPLAAPEAPPLPQDVAVVPLQPTEAMIEAALKLSNEDGPRVGALRSLLIRDYRAMIAAAPSFAQQPASVDLDVEAAAQRLVDRSAELGGCPTQLLADMLDDERTFALELTRAVLDQPAQVQGEGSR